MAIAHLYLEDLPVLYLVAYDHVTGAEYNRHNTELMEQGEVDPRACWILDLRSVRVLDMQLEELHAILEADRAGEAAGRLAPTDVQAVMISRGTMDDTVAKLYNALARTGTQDTVLGHVRLAPDPETALELCGARGDRAAYLARINAFREELGLPA